MGDAAENVEEFQLEPPSVGAAYVKPRIKELTALAQRLKDAQEQFKDATDIVAQKAQIAPGALRAYVKAQVQDDPSKIIDKKSDEYSDFCMLAGELD